MRQWVTPRSLMLHAAFVLIAAGCLIAGWWQVHRAMQGNTLSYLYSVGVAGFAVVAGIGWWQMFHDTPEDIAERKSHHARMPAPPCRGRRPHPAPVGAGHHGRLGRDGRPGPPAGARVAAIGPGDLDEGPGLVPVWSGHLMAR